MRVLAYLRVSTGEQAESGLGIEAQRQAILAEAARRGWSNVEFIEDSGFSGKTINRPGLRAPWTCSSAARRPCSWSARWTG